MTTAAYVTIPDLKNDAKIGDVLAATLLIINESERRGRAVWDYSGVTNLHPFMSTLLGIYKEGRRDLIAEINVSGAFMSGCETSGLMTPLDLSDVRDSETAKDVLASGDGLSICKFRRLSDNIDGIESAISLNIRKMVAAAAGTQVLSSAISYILAEMTCNIQEHSEASHGYVSASCPPGDGHLYLCIADNGRTIHGCFAATAKKEFVRLIGDDHAEAIRYSTKGVSTKNRPDNESRGYGISTNLDMVINGLGGSFTILSGEAIFRSDRSGEQLVALPTDVSWDGTVIMVKIPLKQKEGFDVYKYIE